MNPSFIYLFLSCSSSALAVLAVVVHGDRPAAWGLAALPALWVQHPPRALSRALILDANKAAVQRQVVSDGVLEDRESEEKRKPG